MLKFVLVFFVTVQLLANECCLASKLGLRRLKSAEDIEAFFPLTKEALIARKNTMIEGFESATNKLLSSKISFDNTAKLYDLAFGSLGYGAEMFEMVGMVHTDPILRKLASDTGSEMRKLMQSTLLNHPEIYIALTSIETENLSKAQRYFLEETGKELKAQGLGLQEGYRGVVKLLQTELIDLSDAFLRNVREDKQAVIATREELQGMSTDFIQNLEMNADGNYILTLDYPVYFPIMKQCAVSQTREKMLKAFSNRGYPDNEKILSQISCKRNGLSHVLGHPCFASLQLEQEMVKSPKRAQAFLDEMGLKLAEKQRREIEVLKQDLPDNVQLDENGNFYPWDLSYCINQYRKKHFDLDEEKLKVYFPLEHTLRGLMDVYEKFMSVKLDEIPVDLWHEDVRLVRVSDPKTGFIHGFIGLDLHPRPGKYTHACDVPVHPAFSSKRCEAAALSVLICNFPKGTPSLMRPNDVRTFFHEFGHALHDMLGRTHLISTCGTNTKTDFVELPSQILEEWLWDKDVLQMCSSHYETGKKLPDQIISRMLASKTAFTGIEIMRQVMLANYSLHLHTKPTRDLGALWKKFETQYQPHFANVEHGHYYLSFGHLSHYAARYYGYLWSRVFACDVFEKIKQEGLLNPEVGKRYINAIIGKGGSQDPTEMLKNFLGREPSQDAFFRMVGLHGN